MWFDCKKKVFRCFRIYSKITKIAQHDKKNFIRVTLLHNFFYESNLKHRNNRKYFDFYCIYKKKKNKKLEKK